MIIIIMLYGTGSHVYIYFPSACWEKLTNRLAIKQLESQLFFVQRYKQHENQLMNLQWNPLKFWQKGILSIKINRKGASAIHKHIEKTLIISMRGRLAQSFHHTFFSSSLLSPLRTNNY